MLYLEGKRFGKLTVIERADNYKWLCLCDCGTYCKPYTWNLTTHKVTSCGCVKGIKPNFVFDVVEAKSHTTFLQVAWEFIEMKKSDWAMSTYINHINILNNFKCLNDVDIKQFNTSNMRTILDYYAQPRYSMHYYSKVRSFFYSILSYAVATNRLESNPIENIKQPRKQRKNNDIYWTEQEFIKFINTFEFDTKGSELMLIYALAFYGGLRKEEVVAIRIKDIDLERKCIKKNEVWSFNAQCFDNPKTHNSDRVIGICDQLYNFIELFAELNNIKFDKENNGLLFGRIPSASYIRYHLVKHQQGLDLPYLTFHRLRHSHAVLALSCASSLDLGYIYAVAKHLGHTPKTLLRTYMHATYTEQDIINNINNKC